MTRIALLLTTLALTGLSAAPLRAQCINGKLSYPLYKAGAEQVHDLDEAGKEVVHIEYDLIFDSKDMYRNLSTTWDYTFKAFADGGAADVDVAVYVYDDLLDQYTLVAADSSYEATATVAFTPTEDVEHRVRVTVKSFNEGYTVARYGLLIYHD